ncbi:hypothetical protein Patl1_06430 [Pistacia atlantica]|uniref:Uncharacterized protein n=1 Tax=Pistacia atlantica TaxID=434234 RepID=A0ACC1BTH7_9ROSI|nr:hypothetical protein Patl1_06430 [Pistacia atlantica]
MEPKAENRYVQEEEGLGWGKSLPVPSVQEIVRNDSQIVPEKYIQERKDRPTLDSEFSPNSSEIPVINFSLLENGDEDELGKLDIACKEWGFFQKLSDELAAKLSLLMGMDKEGLKKLYGEMKQAMRLNYYPACSRPDLVLGVSAHSDASALTLLLQDDEITALQIRHKGTWVPVKPIPNALVVNIGDVAEAWSNGVYKSIEHRAVTNVNKARMSIATFMMPNEELEIGPLESMMDDKHRPKLYRKIKYVDYIRHTLERKMDGKAHTEYLKLESV